VKSSIRRMMSVVLPLPDQPTMEKIFMGPYLSIDRGISQ
jgi:hypothetical protein